MAGKKKTERVEVPEVSAEDFVKAWQAGANVAEVVEALGYTDDGARERVMRRAASYRKLGVKLKKMPRGLAASLDVDALNALVEG